MLEKLDSVGWGGLTHAYGTAEEIPAFIVALRSTDQGVRAEARDELWSSLLGEGRRYEADAYAVPFLVDLVSDPSTRDRVEILHLLTAIAIGSDHPYLLTGFPIDQLRPTPDAVDESWYLRMSELYHQWSGRPYGDAADRLSHTVLADVDELRAYDAVRAEVPRILELLADEVGEVVEAAAYLLAWFPEQAAVTVGPLTEVALRQGWRRDLRVTVLLAAGLAARQPMLELVTALDLLAHADPELRWAAATAWTVTAGSAASEQVRAQLRARAAEGVQPDEPLLDPWGMRRAEWSVRLLEHIGDPAGAEIRGAWVAAAVAVPHTGAWHEHYELPFHLAFGDAERARPVPFAALTPPERWLVEHLVRHPDAFIAEPDAMPDLLRWYGLPTDHQELAAYASAP